MTPDPYTNSGQLNDPQSWNRYAYTRGDPVNGNDPMGLDIFYECLPDECGGGDGMPGGGNFQDSGGYCDPSQGPGFCGNPCVGVDGTPNPNPFCQGIPPVGVPAPAPPKVITLRVIDKCIYPNGTSDLPGAFTLEVEYEVLVNGQPVLGITSLGNAGISTVNETITTTSGGPITGNGNWCLSTASCDEPGSLTPAGTFWDILAGNGTANQSFTINGQTISVSFLGVTGAFTVLKNLYNSSGKSISVGGGALIGNSTIRECGTKKGDPSAYN